MECWDIHLEEISRDMCKLSANAWWRHQMRLRPFVRGIHRSPVNSPHKGQWRGALMFSLICVWINGWINNRDAGDLRRHLAHYDVTVMKCQWKLLMQTTQSTMWGHPISLITINFNPTWISNYIHNKVWDEITYPLPNFNGAKTSTVVPLKFGKG